MQGFSDLARQGVFIYLSTLDPIGYGKGFPPQLYIIPTKKLLWASTQTTRKDEKFGARMAQSAEKAADVGFRNQKWTPERALFNDTNERFQL